MLDDAYDIDDINDMRDYHTLKYWPRYILVDSLDFILVYLSNGETYWVTE